MKAAGLSALLTLIRGVRNHEYDQQPAQTWGLCSSSTYLPASHIAYACTILPCCHRTQSVFAAYRTALVSAGYVMLCPNHESVSWLWFWNSLKLTEPTRAKKHHPRKQRKPARQLSRPCCDYDAVKSPPPPGTGMSLTLIALMAWDLGGMTEAWLSMMAVCTCIQDYARRKLRCTYHSTLVSESRVCYPLLSLCVSAWR